MKINILLLLARLSTKYEVRVIEMGRFVPVPVPVPVPVLLTFSNIRSTVMIYISN